MSSNIKLKVQRFVILCRIVVFSNIMLLVEYWVVFPRLFTTLGLNFDNILKGSFYASSLTPFLLAHRVHRLVKQKSWAYFLDVHTSKVGRIFVGKTERHQRMPTGAFSLCAIRLVKLTPQSNIFQEWPKVSLKTRQSGDGASLLHCAAQNAQTDFARILLTGSKSGTKPGSVNAKTFSWSTPLHEVSMLIRLIL